MLTTPPSRWAVQGLTFAVWALAAASAVYWGLKLTARSSATPAVPFSARGPAMPDPSAIARLLGGAPVQAAAIAAPSLASRLSLVGVVARPSHSGVALISVDGKPAKPFRVGSTVEEGLVLQSLEPRRAKLGPSVEGPAAVTLELPPLAAAQAGPVPPAATAAIPTPALGPMPPPSGVGLPATTMRLQPPPPNQRPPTLRAAPR